MRVFLIIFFVLYQAVVNACSQKKYPSNIKSVKCFLFLSCLFFLWRDVFCIALLFSPCNWLWEFIKSRKKVMHSVANMHQKCLVYIMCFVRCHTPNIFGNRRRNILHGLLLWNVISIQSDYTCEMFVFTFFPLSLYLSLCLSYVYMWWRGHL